MDHVGAPHLVRAAFAQAQQAGGVVDLAVHQDDRADTGIAQLPALIDNSAELGNQTLAEQFTAQALPIAQAAELLWQAQLAGHSSGYLAPLQQLIQTCTREDLQRAAGQLNDAAGGWRCVANGPPIDGSWQTAG